MLPSSKDSTPESQVLAASFSCRLLMISWSSEPELLWRRKKGEDPEKGGREGAETNSRLVSDQQIETGNLFLKLNSAEV